MDLSNPSLNNKKNICANSEMSHSSDSEAGGFTLQELEHLHTLVQNDVPTGGNAYQYWNNRLLAKIDKLCQEKRNQQEKILQEWQNHDNWTKVLSQKKQP